MSLDRFMELFQGRSDAFAEQQEDGSYRPIRRPMTAADYIAHGKGEHTYGIYSVRADDATKFIVWDIDTLFLDTLDAITDALCDLEIPRDSYLIEFSGRKGHHVWLPFDHWAPASHAWYAGRAVMQYAGVEVECYPKQKFLNDLGNLIKLPLGIHRVSGQWSQFIGGWADVKPINAFQLVRLVDLYQEPTRPGPVVREPTTSTASAQETLNRLLDEVASAPVGQRNETLHRIAGGLFRGWRSNSHEELVVGLMDAAMRAGLSRREAGTTISSVARFVEQHPSVIP